MAAVSAALAISSSQVAAPLPLAAGPPDGASSLHSYIVVLEDWVSSPGAVARQHLQEFTIDVLYVYRFALRGYATITTREVAVALNEDPRVAWIELDGAVSASGQVVPFGIDRIDAERSSIARIDGRDERVEVDVAVIDSGVDLDHPDLHVAPGTGKNCSLLGLAEAVPPEDVRGHGTIVAGIIGALDNGVGVVGVAPGARIWPVKVLNDDGRGHISQVVCGVDYVTAHAEEIEVANMSLGGDGGDDGRCGQRDQDALHKAICASVEEGVTYVVGAGNDSKDAATLKPAAYDEVITVSSLTDYDGAPGGRGERSSDCVLPIDLPPLDEDDSFSDFSNYGTDIDFIAPGRCILSTAAGGTYGWGTGTSVAAPHVAGAAALFKALHRAALPKTIKKALFRVGNLDWNWSDASALIGGEDQDALQERLVNVARF